MVALLVEKKAASMAGKRVEWKVGLMVELMVDTMVVKSVELKEFDSVD